ncbi:MAG: hypothetical protein O9286_02895 [Aquidulcibacter sp.]|nr:hypothetical protein [Aquidulcibacter sp.]
MGLDVGRQAGPDDNRDVFSGALGFGTAETHSLEGQATFSC